MRNYRDISKTREMLKQRRAREAKSVEDLLQGEERTDVPFMFEYSDCKTMDEAFKIALLYCDLTATLTITRLNKGEYMYELSFCQKGYEIEVCATAFELARKYFLEATKPENIDKYRVERVNNPSLRFDYKTMEFLC